MLVKHENSPTEYNVCSVRDIFGDNIVLRDLEPRNAKIRGLSKIFDKLEIPEGVVPRKNEPVYAAVVESFVHDLCEGQAKGIVYVGDTIFNDGSVIKNLRTRGHEIVGFICNERKEASLGDFMLGDIILAENWSSIWKALREALRRGISIGPELVAIFDLDQTVYAAKGRHDEPLKRARLEAVHALLRDIVGEPWYDIVRVERLYREFDSDNYHALTRDNQDYVVFLALVGCLGFYDIEDIKKRLADPTASMLVLIEDTMVKVEQLKGHEDVKRIQQLIKEIYFNARAGDQTPCKTFRQGEYCTTYKWMSGDVQGDETLEVSQRIPVTLEIVDLIEFLRAKGVSIFALSDRPVEATEPSETLGLGGKSLLDVSMPVRGIRAAEHLRALT